MRKGREASTGGPQVTAGPEAGAYGWQTPQSWASPPHSTRAKPRSSARCSAQCLMKSLVQYSPLEGDPVMVKQVAR